MKRTTIALVFLLAAILAVATYSGIEHRQLLDRMDQLSFALDEMRTENDQLRNQLESVQSNLDDIQVAAVLARAACDTRFPAGLYRLITSTSYGPGIGSEYEIYHASVLLAQWSVNTGMRVNALGIPTDFYLDYDGDGRIDTTLAARFVREIPIAGNTIADRLLADSRVHQNLYSVFSCEWRNADYTSAEDMNNSVSGTSEMLWDLVQENSASLLEWIRSE